MSISQDLTSRHLTWISLGFHIEFWHSLKRLLLDGWDGWTSWLLINQMKPGGKSGKRRALWNSGIFADITKVKNCLEILSTRQQPYCHIYSHRNARVVACIQEHLTNNNPRNNYQGTSESILTTSIVTECHPASSSRQFGAAVEI